MPLCLSAKYLNPMVVIFGCLIIRVPPSDPLLQADVLSSKMSCAGSFLYWKTAFLNQYVQTLL